MKYKFWFMVGLAMWLALSACTSSGATDSGSSGGSESGSQSNSNTVAGDKDGGADTSNTDSGGDVSNPNDLDLADPSQVEVKGTWYIDEETNFLHALGTVKNNTDHQISGMIKFNYLDASGNPITVDALEENAFDTVSFYAPIAPGATGYYERLRDLAKVGGTIAKVETSLDYAVLEKESPVMEITNMQWQEDGDGNVAVTGSVKNSGTSGCNFPGLWIVMLKDGMPVTISGASLDGDPETLAQGGEQAFSATGYVYDFDYDDVAVVAECSPTSFPRP